MADISHLSDSDKQIIKRSSRDLYIKFAEYEHTTNGVFNRATAKAMALQATKYVAYYEEAFDDDLYSDLVDDLQDV